MDYRGVVHREFLPEGQTVNKEYYLGVMRLCVEQFVKKYPICIIREHLAENETNTIQQSPNSPDLTPCDFFLFVRLKKPLRGTRYSTRDEVMKN